MNIQSSKSSARFNKNPAVQPAHWVQNGIRQFRIIPFKIRKNRLVSISISELFECRFYRYPQSPTHHTLRYPDVSTRGIEYGWQTFIQKIPPAGNKSSVSSQLQYHYGTVEIYQRVLSRVATCIQPTRSAFRVNRCRHRILYKHTCRGQRSSET